MSAWIARHNSPGGRAKISQGALFLLTRKDAQALQIAHFLRESCATTRQGVGLGTAIQRGLKKATMTIKHPLKLQRGLTEPKKGSF